jgi:uncharacterized membrane protein HdeD (DUF308 family)
MERELAHNWWVVALRGVLAILFGVAAFLWPGLVWLAVVATFAAYALLDGGAAIVAAVRGQGQAGPWWALLLEGLVSILAGVAAIAWPGITELALLGVIAAWCTVTGVFEIIAAVRLRREIQGEWLLALSGFLSVIFGLALVFMPVAGLLVIAWWIGAYAVTSGALLLALSFRMRGLARHAPPRPAGVAVS